MEANGADTDVISMNAESEDGISIAECKSGEVDAVVDGKGEGGAPTTQILRSLGYLGESNNGQREQPEDGIEMGEETIEQDGECRAEEPEGGAPNLRSAEDDIVCKFELEGEDQLVQTNFNEPKRGSRNTGGVLQQRLQLYNAKLRQNQGRFSCRATLDASDSPESVVLKIIKKEYEGTFIKCLCTINHEDRAVLFNSRIAIQLELDLTEGREVEIFQPFTEVLCGENEMTAILCTHFAQMREV
mmetsp:Transcript_5626/g.14534  ORF Transcript_5626/g.14534 Transcript_5626/m.14534 type:complete len:244 (+) Transcript_5626:85-816(+)